MEIRIKLSEKYLNEKEQEVNAIKDVTKDDVINSIGKLLAIAFFRQESTLHECVEIDAENLEGESEKSALEKILLPLSAITGEVLHPEFTKTEQDKE